MGDDYCSIHRDTNNNLPKQMEAAQRLANEVILEDRAVEVRFAPYQDARELELRKMPPANRRRLSALDGRCTLLFHVRNK